MADARWVLRAAATAGLVGADATDVRGRSDSLDAFDTLAEALLRSGRSVAERALPSRLGQVTPGTVVQRSSGALAVVAAATDARIVLVDEQGQRAVAAKDARDGLKSRILVFYAGARGSVLRSLARLAIADPALRRAASAAIGVSVLLRLVALAAPLLTYEALVRATPDAATATLTTLGIAGGLVGVFTAVLLHARARSLVWLECHVSERFCRDIFSRMLEAPYAELSTREAGEAWEGFEAAAQWIRLATPQLVAGLDGLFGLVFLAALGLVDGVAAALCLIIAVATFALVVLSARRQEPAYRAILDAKRARQSALLECLDSMDVVRAEVLERRWERVLDELLRDELRPELVVADGRAWIEGAAQAASRALMVVVFATVGWRAIAGTASVAEVVAAVQLVTAFGLGFRDVLMLPGRAAALRAIEPRLARDLAPSPRASRASDPRSIGPARGPDLAVEIRDASFRHPHGDEWVFRGFDFEVRRGQHVVLSWPSGSGKTTLLRLIAGLLAPTRGTVFVEGEPAEPSRRLVHYVPQGTPLLDASIWDNLVALSGGASHDAIERAARASGLADVVTTFPLGWDMVLSGGGRTISSGQAQLVVLTAALASPAPILLLDEAMAHLDAETRRRFLAARPFEGRTVISVEHGGELA